MIYLTFSSIPARINKIKNILESIGKQTIKPDKILMFLPYHYKRFNTGIEIPPFINDFDITIIRTEDYGPITKLIPILTLDILWDDNDIIVSFDDDTEYPVDWLERLVVAAEEDKNTAFGYRGKAFSPTNLSYPPINPPNKGYVDIITGVWGFLHRRKFLSMEIFELLKIVPSAFFNDDVFLCGYYARNNIRRKLIQISDINRHGTILAHVDALHLQENADNKNNNNIINYFKEDFIKTLVYSDE